MDPVAIESADDRLAGGPHGETLLQLLAASVRHPGDLGRESLDVLRLLAQQRLGDEQRERHVLVSGALDHPVEGAADVLPQRPSVGTDDHAPADRRVVGELGAANDVDVPAIEVLALRCDRLGILLDGHGGRV